MHWKPETAENIYRWQVLENSTWLTMTLKSWLRVSNCQEGKALIKHLLPNHSSHKLHDGNTKECRHTQNQVYVCWKQEVGNKNAINPNTKNCTHYITGGYVEFEKQLNPSFLFTSFPNELKTIPILWNPEHCPELVWNPVWIEGLSFPLCHQ